MADLNPGDQYQDGIVLKARKHEQEEWLDPHQEVLVEFPDESRHWICLAGEVSQ